jgi:hypothetical protein
MDGCQRNTAHSPAITWQSHGIRLRPPPRDSNAMTAQWHLRFCQKHSAKPPVCEVQPLMVAALLAAWLVQPRHRHPASPHPRCPAPPLLEQIARLCPRWRAAAIACLESRYPSVAGWLRSKQWCARRDGMARCTRQYSKRKGHV